MEVTAPAPSSYITRLHQPTGNSAKPESTDPTGGLRPSFIELGFHRNLLSGATFDWRPSPRTPLRIFDARLPSADLLVLTRTDFRPLSKNDEHDSLYPSREKRRRRPVSTRRSRPCGRSVTRRRVRPRRAPPSALAVTAPLKRLRFTKCDQRAPFFFFLPSLH